MNWEQFRQSRYNALTAAGKKQYASDSAYRQRRESQWRSEYNNRATSAPSGGNPGGIGSLQQQYGTGGSSTAYDPDDPPVYWGEDRPSGGGFGGFGRSASEYSRMQTPKDKIKSYSESEGDYYGLSEAELRRVQESAFQAGVFGDDRGDVPWGDFDEDTFKFWRAMVARSAAFYAKGKKISPWDAMDSAARAGRNRSGGKGPTKEPLVIRGLVAPEDVNAIGDKLGESELGMGISDTEAAAYVSAYQAMQVAEQTAAYEAGGSGLPGGPGGRAPALPDLSSWLLDRIRKDHPEEYQKTTYRNAVHTVLELIQAGGLGT